MPGLIVTNNNHIRDAGAFAERFSLPIFAHRDSYPEKRPAALTTVTVGTRILDTIEVIEIAGAVPGEIALHAPESSTLIVGDALINFEPYGFTFLPGTSASFDR